MEILGIFSIEVAPKLKGSLNWTPSLCKKCPHSFNLYANVVFTTARFFFITSLILILVPDFVSNDSSQEFSFIISFMMKMVFKRKVLERLETFDTDKNLFN